MKRPILLFITTLLLSACGFHLRGWVDTPAWLNNVAVISKDDERQLTTQLKERLEAYKISVTNVAQAQYWIIINSVSLQQQIISIGASTNPRQYQLNLRVRFMLQTANGQIIKPESTLLVTRQATINNDRILGSNQEEQILINEMQQDAANQIINRLSRK